MIDKYRLVNDTKYFSSNVLQSYVAFISANRYFKLFSGNIKFICENLKECKKKSIKSITKSERKFAPTFIHTNLLPDVKFNGYCNKYDS